jgi:hypothetical protein
LPAVEWFGAAIAAATATLAARIAATTRTAHLGLCMDVSFRVGD